MTNYLLYAAFLLAGAGLTYVFLRNRLSSSLSRLDKVLDQFKSRGTIRLSEEYIALPENLKPLANKVDLLVSEKTSLKKEPVK